MNLTCKTCGAPATSKAGAITTSCQHSTGFTVNMTATCYGDANLINGKPNILEQSIRNIISIVKTKRGNAV